MKRRTFTDEQVEQCRAFLLKLFAETNKLYVVNRGKNAAGERVWLDVYFIDPAMTPTGGIDSLWLSSRIAAVLGWKFDEKKECLYTSHANCPVEELNRVFGLNLKRVTL